MTEKQKNIVISKTNSGFPDYLDFDKLRTEGIEYLGRLSGKIWTDHNVHDPGITILELLCYALLDLGYRTNLPVEDLLTRNPEDKSADNNFFTPSQILTCNPLTVTDFRKLLIDIEGVKNAWLEVATDHQDFCRRQLNQDDNPTFMHVPQARQIDCITYLNGLYHVYIDLEKDVEKVYKNNDEEKNIYLKDLADKIKMVLMAHRNLCEDFIDIYFLCKQETGVCADIELEEGADAEKVYIDIIERLRVFFSPSPQFYTLQQLLDKQKPIDEIFAGRPYNITESHGFIDTEELENLQLRKEIHLSDVYNALFEVEGVKTVSRLHLQICKNNKIKPLSGWKFKIPKNNVPEFSLACSGFQFSRRGMPVLVDVKKFDGLFEINFSHNGKILHTVPSPYLDNEIPRGVYRTDLADYYSIQNEFPRVYGIAEGGLPDDAPVERKAQAYQLKGYLLFFDQLLANYLSQLQQMRSLFALSASKQDNHTYFINQLNTVPELQKLLRFNIHENNANSLGAEGTILVVPIDKKKLLELKATDRLKSLEIEETRSCRSDDEDKLKAINDKIIKPYTFATLAEQDTVINQLKNDLAFDQYQCEYITKTDGCIYYYILTCSDEIALVSKKYFRTVQEAAENAASVKYIGTFDENYRSFTTHDQDFSFDIELNLLSFEKYLQLFVESEDLYIERRQSFLNHLLARFAEKFTDYTLLSFGFLNNQQSSLADIKSKENFITHYDDLSSNRGKAYDYLENNWNNDNASGFENKVKALSGINNGKRHSLCNFEVAEYEEQFQVELKIAGSSYFKVNERFDTREEALVAARDLFRAMRNKDNYQPEFIEHDNAYKLIINYAPDHAAVFPLHYTTKEDTMVVASNLRGLFVEKNPADAVFESTYVYIPKLNDQAGNTVRRSKRFFATDDKARNAAMKAARKIDDRRQWEYDKDGPSMGSLYYDAKKTDILSFINTDAFKIDINDTIVGKPDKFSYDLLDNENRFKFQSANEFSSEDEAGTDADELLTLLTDEKNFEIFKNEETNKVLIRVVYNEKIWATCFIEQNSQKQAEESRQAIIDIVKMHQYFILIDKVPHLWKFSYLLGYEKSNQYTFHSVHEYPGPEAALAAATLFYHTLPTLRVDVVRNELFLEPHKKKADISSVKLFFEGEPEDIKKLKTDVDKLLTEQKEVKQLSENPEPSAFSNSVDIDPVSKQGRFVYRLIDKDRNPAFYSKLFSDNNSAKSGIKSLSKLFKYGAPYLQIYLGGDIITKRKDEATKITWYHYQIKCLNQFYPSGPLAGKPLILFESTKGYQSHEDAEKAFNENYLILIHLASDISNYGETISLSETFIHNEELCIKGDNIVFVPKDTYQALGAWDEAVKNEIIKRAATYPIRMVQNKSKQFYNLYPCEKKPEENDSTDKCKKEEKKYVYYFTMFSPLDKEKWQSLKFYDTPEETKKEFDFFLMLLWYPGNYYVDCDDCDEGGKDKNKYRIYLREVLAESAERFATEEQAWGKKEDQKGHIKRGLHQFICVSQSVKAFHTYQRKRDCCYSFYVACGTGFVYHPCKYDTPKKRDDALLKLYRSFNESIKRNAWQADDTGDTLILKNGKGARFAAMEPDNRDDTCIPDRIALLSRFADKDEHYREEGGKIVLKGENYILATSIEEGATLGEWKEMLRLFICYYPIVKIETANTRDKSDQYCIEIKLSGFNPCKEDIAEEQPCGCADEATGDEQLCYIAWKGRCCYKTCKEAEQALQNLMKLLLNYNYYQPVFDCSCYSYGIELKFSKNMTLTDDNISHYGRENVLHNWDNSKILAINPQCYSSPELACEAVERSKALINSEGLHVVEHILLRPHCEADCQCRQYRERCENKTGCNNFTWKLPKDPCAEDKEICFVPGIDPYSFIATVALPAWPERFRKKENRILLENILYREAPAHVLLRILWLAPHDFCCFETKYKGWGRWLAQKKNCIDDFSVCDFLEFLFNRHYECLDDCYVCLHCEENTQPKSCFDREDDGGHKITYLGQINDLYCWQDQQCGEYKYIDCEGSRQIPDTDPDTLLAVVKEPILLKLKDKGIKDADIAEKKMVSQEKVRKQKLPDLQKPKTGINKVIPAAEPAITSARRKPQLVNGRMTKYRTDAAVVLEKSKNNPIAAHVQRFLADPLPSPERIAKLVTEVLQNNVPNTKGSKKFTNSQVHNLLQSSICYYLDKICFDGKDMDKLNELKKIFAKLRTAKINIKGIYDYWNLPEVIKYEPELNDKEVDKLFNLKKK